MRRTDITCLTGGTQDQVWKHHHIFPEIEEICARHGAKTPDELVRCHQEDAGREVGKMLLAKGYTEVVCAATLGTPWKFVKALAEEGLSILQRMPCTNRQLVAHCIYDDD